MRPNRRFLALVLASGLLLAACGEGSDGDPAPEAADDPADTTDDGAEETDEPDGTDGADGTDGTDEPDAAAGADAVTISTSQSELGEILVDGEGMSLYVFDPDEQGESTCYDECAQNWPPLIAEGGEDAVEADAGADGELLGTTERDDGSAQVTYDDWPLYHWAADEEPGDVSGQGVGDQWWVIAPSGEPLREATMDDGTEDADAETSRSY